MNDSISLLGAVFNGDAAGPGAGDPQERNRYGTNFRVNDPPLAMMQASYSWNNKKGDPGLSGAVKLGAWRHFGDFADQHWGADGMSLADATSSGISAKLSGNYGFWIVAEQELCHFDGDEDRTAGLFLRASSSPADRNPIDFYADAGVEVVGVDRRRPHDKIGFAVGYAHVSKALRALDLDYRQNVTGWPVRDSETMVTAAYQYEIQSGWTVQPSIQYIMHPGGGASQTTPGRKLTNASVLGIRTIIKF